MDGIDLKLFKWFRKNKINSCYYQLSVTGRRDVNQDECIVLELGNESFFLAVADGMGGAANGYIASNIAINVACDIVENNFKSKKNIKEEELKDILSSIYLKIQSVIRDQENKNSRLNGMGTTLACLLINRGKYAWSNIGDSRIFKYKNKSLIKLTEDHSYINDFEKENNNPAPSEMKDNYGHLLTKCLDGGEDKPDIFPLDKDYEELTDKDFFLLCSDGLILNKEYVKGKHLLKILNRAFKSNKLEKAARQMIDNSFKEGSTDNISLILYLNK